MAKRIANHTVVLMREGQRVTIKAGQKFDFTSAEMKEIEESSPDALRKMVNEDESVTEVKVPTPERVIEGDTATNEGGLNAGTKVGSGDKINTKLDPALATTKGRAGKLAGEDDL